MKKIKERINLISPLNEQEQMELLDSGDVELMQQYFDKKKLQLNFSDDAEIRLVRSGNVAMMKIYSRHYYLSEKAEIELVKTGNLEMLKVYLKGTFVSEAAKIECIKLGNVELIESYMMYQGRFSEEAQDALIKLGNAKLIESYCCHWGFCNKLKGAAKEVLERYHAKAE